MYLAGTKVRGLKPGKGNSYRKPFEYGSFFFHALTLYSEISTIQFSKSFDGEADLTGFDRCTVDREKKYM